MTASRFRFIVKVLREESLGPQELLQEARLVLQDFPLLDRGLRSECSAFELVGQPDPLLVARLKPAADGVVGASFDGKQVI